MPFAIRHFADGAQSAGKFHEQESERHEAHSLRTLEASSRASYLAAQNCRLESSRIVTGPSLTSSTCMSAPNTPVATGSTPAERNPAMNRW